MTPLYDYYEASGKRILIYVGRFPDPKSDPGIFVSQSVLLAMYRRGLLTGEALKDAEVSFRGKSPVSPRRTVFDPGERSRDQDHDPD
jgi:hypothetical protein